MEESLRSGGAVKKKTSSGCLIVKKKGDVLGRRGGFLPMEKRSRVLMSDFGLGEDSLEPARRKYYDTMPDENVVYGKRVVEDQEYRRNGWNFEGDRKRSKVVEYGEYGFEGKSVRNDYMKIVQRNGSLREFGGGPSGHMVEKRKHSKFDNSSSGLSWRDEVGDFGEKRRYAMDEDEAHLPVSLSRSKYQEETAQRIRLQGKNGVLKVMVNKNRKIDLFSTSKYGDQVVQNRNEFKSEDLPKDETPICTPFYLDPRKEDEGGVIVKSEKSQLKLEKPMLEKHKKAGNCERERSELELQKSPLDKSNRAGDYESNRTDPSLKLAPPSLSSSGSMKAAKREEKRSLPTQNVTLVKAKEEKITQGEDKIQSKCKKDKAKNGGSTEKQLLRERIREMLLKSGWTIDYRPRRNRDYLDAVYINPQRTAYWSIIKAYEALQKQFQEAGIENQLDKVSDSLINKLTRQTKKKIEKEMKKKRGHDSMMKNSEKAISKLSCDGSDDEQQEERLSSFVKQNGKAKKVKAREVHGGTGDDLSVDSIGGKYDPDNTSSPPATNSSVAQARKSRKIGRCTLLVRTSSQHSESHGYVPYMGKRTLLAWLIDAGTVQLSERVKFVNRRKSLVKLEGWITREGIHCGCCSKILTVSKFELHAGSKLHQPFQNIILESGPSLLQCLIDAWNKQDEAALQDFYIVGADGDDPDDDTCGICGDGGDLICCDGCPSTFHLSCLGLQILPPGDWHCPNCTCKFCGKAGRNVLEEDTETSSELAMCNLCEQKYHKACSKRVAALLLACNGPLTFCGKKCQEIHYHLQKILWVKHELESGFSWSLIRRTDLDCDTEDHEYPQRVEGNAKLAVALSAMDECFVPFTDRRSGINLIHNVFYNCGSNYSRLNFRGFYAMVLERGDEIISTASVRFRGAQLAEMPYIGTRHMYRHQGMCRRLLSAIESVLCSLKIEKLIIPAIAEHMDTWTVAFGFKKLEESRRKEMKMLNLLVFPGTDWLQKSMLKQEIPAADEKCTESNDNSPQLHVSLESSDMDSFMEEETNMQDDIGSSHTGKISYEADAIAPIASESPALSKDTTVSHALNCTELADVCYGCEESKCVNDQPVEELAVSSDGLKYHSSDPALETLQTKSSVSCHQIKDDARSSAEDLTGVNLDVKSLETQDGENFTLVGLHTNLQVPLEASRDNSFQNRDEEHFALVEFQTNLQVSSEASRNNSFQAQDEENFTLVVLQTNLQVPSEASNDTSFQNWDGENFTSHINSSQQAGENLSLVELQTNLQVPPEASDEAEVLQTQGNGCSSVKFSDDGFPESIEESTCMEHSPGPIEETFQNATGQTCMEFGCFSATVVGEDPPILYSSDVNQGNAVNEVVSQSYSEICLAAEACVSAKVDIVKGAEGSSVADDVDDSGESEGRVCYYLTASDFLVEASNQNTEGNSSRTRDEEHFTLVELQTNLQVPSEASHNNSFLTPNAENFTLVELQTYKPVPSEASHSNSFQQDGQNITLIELQTNLQVPPEASDEAEQNQGDGCFSVKFYNDAFSEAVDESTSMEHNAGPAVGTSLQGVADQTYMEFGCIPTACVGEDPSVQLSSNLNLGNAANGEGSQAYSEIHLIAGASIPTEVDIVCGSQGSSVADDVDDTL